MNTKSNILWITRTAILTALLIILQAATAPLGNTLITGSIVNLLLILSVMTSGLLSGATVAIISPIVAKFFGIGPLWSLLPFIILGNIALIFIWHFIGKRSTWKKVTIWGIALVTAAIAKFLVLYLGIVKIAVPFLLGLPEQQAAAISSLFSIPQLVTAVFGGILAILVLPILKKALSKEL